MTGPHIGIVGAGPRGTIALDRVLANAGLAGGRRITVHLVDPEVPGAGRVFRTDQSPELLMNTVCADVTVFTDDSVRCLGPIRPGPSQYDWARLVVDGAVGGVPAEVVAEARRLQPWSYASRAFHGHYLGWAFARVVATAPDGVAVVVHRDRGVAVDDLPGGGQLLRLAGGDELPLDALVLATGHYEVELTAAERECRDFAARAGLRYLPPASPAEVDLSGIRPGEPVLLRGLGLAFFDYVTLLTAGRGGRFEPSGYRPSGREPVLWAGSRRGLPHASRPEIRQRVPVKHQPRFLTEEVVAEFRRHAGSGRTGFLREVWPYVVREVEWVYYSQVLAGDPGRQRRLQEALRTLPPAAAEEAEAVVAELVPDPALRLDWLTLHRPAGDRTFTDYADCTGWVRDRLQDDVAQSLAGPAGSARKALAAAIRDLRPPISRVVSHAGLSGSSYRSDVVEWFTGLFNAVANGPPVHRIQELVALVDAGVVRFVGPELRVVPDEAAGAFAASSPAVPSAPVHARVLVEARLQDTDLRRTADPLLASLVSAGQARPHVIPDRTGEGYRSGGLDVTEGSQQVVDAAGRPHPARFAYGPPVEAVQWLTAIGARPAANSSTLLQGDLIAREAITAACQVFTRRA